MVVWKELFAHKVEFSHHSLTIFFLFLKIQFYLSVSPRSSLPSSATFELIPSISLPSLSQYIEYGRASVHCRGGAGQRQRSTCVSQSTEHHSWYYGELLSSIFFCVFWFLVVFNFTQRFVRQTWTDRLDYNVVERIVLCMDNVWCWVFNFNKIYAKMWLIACARERERERERVLVSKFDSVQYLRLSHG